MATKKVTEETETVITEERDKSIPLDYYSYFIATYNGYENYEVKLYSRERSANGKIKRSYLGRYYDAPPEEEEIAKLFGIGGFTAQSVDPVTGKFHSRDFDIDERLSYLFKPQGMPGQPSAGYQVPGPMGAQPDPMRYMKDIMGSFITPLMAILKANGNAAAAPGPADNLKMITELMDGLMSSFVGGIKKMQTTMIDSQIENVKKIKPPAKDAEPEENANEWGWLIDLVKAFSAKMFDASGNLTETARKTIKSNPAFTEAFNDQQKLDSIYFTMATDPKVGKEKADAMFTGIGIQPLSDEQFDQYVKEQQEQQTNK